MEAGRSRPLVDRKVLDMGVSLRAAWRCQRPGGKSRSRARAESVLLPRPQVRETDVAITLRADLRKFCNGARSAMEMTNEEIVSRWERNPADQGRCSQGLHLPRQIYGRRQARVGARKRASLATSPGLDRNDNSTTMRFHGWHTLIQTPRRARCFTRRCGCGFEGGMR